jgi:hypothetical protein
MASGFSVQDGGSETSDSQLTACSLSVRTPDSIGTISVSSASMDPSSMIVAVAAAQQLKSKE